MHRSRVFDLVHQFLIVLFDPTGKAKGIDDPPDEDREHSHKSDADVAERERDEGDGEHRRTGSTTVAVKAMAPEDTEKPPEQEGDEGILLPDLEGHHHGRVGDLHGGIRWRMSG